MNTNPNTKVIWCKTCNGKMVVPTDKGKLKVTCPHCKDTFVFEPAPEKKKPIGFVLAACVILAAIAIFVVLYINKNIIPNSVGGWTADDYSSQLVINGINDESIEIKFKSHLYDRVEYFDCQATILSSKKAEFSSKTQVQWYDSQTPDYKDGAVKGTILFSRDKIEIEFDKNSNYYGGDTVTYSRPPIIDPNKYIGKTVSEIEDEFGGYYDESGYLGNAGIDYRNLGIDFLYTAGSEGASDRRIIGIYIYDDILKLNNDCNALMTYDDIKSNYQEVRKSKKIKNVPDFGDRFFYNVSAKSGYLDFVFMFYDEELEKDQVANSVVITNTNSSKIQMMNY